MQILEIISRLWQWKYTTLTFHASKICLNFKAYKAHFYPIQYLLSKSKSIKQKHSLYLLR